MLVVTEHFDTDVKKSARCNRTLCKRNSVYLKGELPVVQLHHMIAQNTTCMITYVLFSEQGSGIFHAFKHCLTSLLIVHEFRFRCSQAEAAKQCRYILCDDCCSSSQVIPVCQQHSPGGTSSSNSRMYHPESNLRPCSEEDEKPVAVNWRWSKSSVIH